jgi:SAM-dependent methyltransferase
MLLAVREAYRLWSTYYDATPNPVTALEFRVLAQRLQSLAGRTFLDAGCGTGRWMAWAAGRGLTAAGIDQSPEMVRIANRKAGIRGRCIIGDAAHQPFGDNAFDIAVCSLTIGYLPDPGAAVRELARVARSVVISDLHPEALARGWKRAFRAGGASWEIEHHLHRLAELDDAAEANGLRQLWRIEAPFGAAERSIFEEAGKGPEFVGMTGFPAIAVTAWMKSSV